MSRPFFWLHIKKAGGQSVRKLLGDLYVETNRKVPTPFVALPKEEWNDALNNFRLPLGHFDFRRALFARDYLYGPDEFSSMFKFAVVRNPYDRIVSCYLYLTGGSRKWQGYRLVGQKRAFMKFLKTLPEKWAEPHKRRNRHVATHTAPVFPDISDDTGQILLDELFHLESIEAEMPVLAQRLGLDKHPMPHENRGKKHRTYRDYYNRESRREVERLFSDDIERLEYDF